MDRASFRPIFIMAALLLAYFVISIYKILVIMIKHEIREGKAYCGPKRCLTVVRAHFHRGCPPGPSFSCILLLNLQDIS